MEGGVEGANPGGADGTLWCVPRRIAASAFTELKSLVGFKASEDGALEDGIGSMLDCL